MSTPHDPIENGKAHRTDDDVTRLPGLIGAAFKRERKRTEKLFDGLLLAVSNDIARLESRLQQKLDPIDTSLSLIARELARRSSDQHSDHTG